MRLPRIPGSDTNVPGGDGGSGSCCWWGGGRRRMRTHSVAGIASPYSSIARLRVRENPCGYNLIKNLPKPLLAPAQPLTLHRDRPVPYAGPPRSGSRPDSVTRCGRAG